MKTLLLLLISFVSSAQKPDTIQQIVRFKGIPVDRYLPRPNTTNQEAINAVAHLDGTNTYRDVYATKEDSMFEIGSDFSAKQILFFQNNKETAKCGKWQHCKVAHTYSIYASDWKKGKRNFKIVDYPFSEGSRHLAQIKKLYPNRPKEKDYDPSKMRANAVRIE